MSVVIVENVIVQFVNQGKGFKVVEETTSGGKTYRQPYTVWADAGHGYKVGDVIPKVSGFLGAKVGKPWVGSDGQERQSVELSINAPWFGGSANAGGPQSTGQVDIRNMEVPF